MECGKQSSFSYMPPYPIEFSSSYNNTPEREWWSWFEVLKMGGMWLAKVARRGEISNAISKNFVGYCVGCEEL